MDNDTSKKPGFAGLEVAAFESRRAKELATLISNLGGVPLVAPSVREVPLEDNRQAFELAERLFARKLDGVIFMTGVGARTLIEILETRYERARIVEALARTTVIARGPKPAKVLQEFNVPVTIVVSEPNTWREILQELDVNPRGFTLPGSRVAVQEYGISNEAFLQGLRDRGVEVLRVPVYRWTLPEDLAPLHRALDVLLGGKVSIVLFTNATQVYHVLDVASRRGDKERLLEALRRCAVCSVGPTCTEALVANGISVDLEPVPPKMGALVHEAAKHSPALLAKKVEVRGRTPEGRSAGSVEVVGREKPAPASAPWKDSRFMKACRREAVDATPVWLMRQAGRYMKEYREVRARVPFLELCKNPTLVSEVTVTAAERLGVDAAIIFADLLLIVEPLGYHLEYDKGEGPVISPGLQSSADVRQLREVNPEESLGYLFDAIRRTRADLDSKTPLIGFAACPFTLASYIIEGGGSRNYVRTKGLMYRDPEAWRALMEHLARSLAKYINGQIAAGVQAIQVFDTWVGCLGPEDYRESVLSYTRMMMHAITPGIPVIHFGTGNPELLEAMRDAGGDIIGVDSRVELDEAWARLGDRVGVQGNLDPVVLYADVEYIRRRVKRILDQAGGRPGHIFNLGHGILPDTPVENVIELVKMVHEMSGRK
ncbi:MAG: uroporphyrinogen decarboxylase [Terriglobia bacterium]